MINREDSLHELALRLRHAAWIAIDTEADSLHAYPEKLCLVQISSADGDELVDPLAGVDLGPLFEGLRDRELILHGSDYDLRLLHRTARFVPQSIFDTMIASRLCGCREFGLASLVRKYLQIEMEKGSQKADWARRPLTPKMEEYARNDTRHLKALSDLLRKQLEGLGRMGWLQETCARLVREGTTPRPAGEIRERWRLSGANRLPRRGMAVLREIWTWREDVAVERNRPPFFVLSHDILLNVAETAGHGQPYEQLIPTRMPSNRRDGLLAAVERGLEVPQSELPHPIRAERRHVTPQEKARFEELKKKRDDAAARLDLDPTVIASKMDLIQLSADPASGAETMMRWQMELLA